MNLRRFAPLACFLSLPSASAETVLLEKSLRPAPTTISGSLVPFALAINGEPVPIARQEFQAIRMNGREIALQDETTRSFFFRTDEDDLEITGIAKDGKTLPVFSAKLPKIRAIEIEGDLARFTLAGDLGKFTLDGKPYSIESPVPVEPGWIDRPHSVEISGEAGSSRIYNLNFTEWRSQELQSWAVGAAPIPPPGSVDGNGYGAYVWRSWENRLVLGGSLNYASVSDVYDLSTYRHERNVKAYAFQVRLGKYPFLPGTSIFDLKRLVVGPYIGKVWTLETHTSIPTSGASTVVKSSESFWIGGFFVRETLLRYRGFGLSLQFDFGFLSNRPGNVRAGPELSYTW